MKVPSYRLHRPSGRAVVTIRGRDYYLGIFNSEESHKQYKQLIADLLDGRIPEQRHKTKLTIAEAIERYTSHLVGSESRADRREVNNFKSAARFLEPDADRQLDEFGPKIFKGLLIRFSEQNWNCTHCNQQGKRIKRMLRWLVTEELYSAEKLAAVREVPGLTLRDAAEPREVLPVSWEVVEATLPLCSLGVRGLIQFQWLTGSRPSEAILVKEEHISKDGRIFTSKDEQVSLPGVWVYSPPTHKTRWLGKKRQILIGPKCQEILSTYLLLARGGHAFDPRGTGRHDDRGERYSPTSYGRSIVRATREAEIEHWHPYQLRHSAGTRFRAAADKDIAGVLLGHVCRSMTTRYARPNWMEAAKVMAKVG
jgi:integrase